MPELFFTRSLRTFHRAGLLSAGLLLTACGSEQAPTAAAAAKRAVPVDVVQIARQPVNQTATYIGRVNPVRTAEVRPQVSGILLKRLFTEGQHVDAGTQLYQIDDRLYEAALRQAQSELAVANANLEQAQLVLKRYKNLNSSQAISQQDLDNANTSFLAAKAQYAVASAKVQTAEVNLQYTHINAPISGVIGRSLVTEGALVGNGQTQPLAIIQQLDPVYVDIKQPVEDMQLMAGQQGDKVVSIQISGADKPLEGKIQFTESRIDAGTNTVNVRVEVANPKQRLLPGMMVQAQMTLKQHSAAILAPQQGIMRQATGDFVAMLVNADNQVEARPVEVIDAIGDQWLIKSGLKEGDRMIIRGLQKVRPGATVAPQLTDEKQNVAKAE